jgi:hypothetical protein
MDDQVSFEFELEDEDPDKYEEAMDPSTDVTEDDEDDEDDENDGGLTPLLKLGL